MDGPGMVTQVPADCRAKFEPERVIGAGGCGVVFRARQLALDRPVAVKVLLADALDQDAARRFASEARITASLKHPHIIGLVDHGADEGVPWIAYELAEGPSLRTRLEASPGGLPLACVVEWTEQIAAALDAAHARDIVHRDLKPDNVLEVAPGVVKVSDFGIAKWGGATSLRTQAGVVLGTPAYIAPEQIDGHPASAASDQYALGISVFELLAGRPPFLGASAVQVLTAHLKQAPPELRALRPDLAPAVEAAIARALAKAPAERHASAGAFAAALARAAGPAGTADRTARAAAPKVRVHRRRPVAVPIAAALFAACLALAAWRVARPIPTVSPSAGPPAPALFDLAAAMSLREPLNQISADLDALDRQTPRDAMYVFEDDAKKAYEIRWRFEKLDAAVRALPAVLHRTFAGAPMRQVVLVCHRPLMDVMRTLDALFQRVQLAPEGLLQLEKEPVVRDLAAVQHVLRTEATGPYGELMRDAVNGYLEALRVRPHRTEPKALAKVHMVAALRMDELGEGDAEDRIHEAVQSTWLWARYVETAVEMVRLPAAKRPAAPPGRDIGVSGIRALAAAAERMDRAVARRAQRLGVSLAVAAAGVPDHEQALLQALEKSARVAVRAGLPLEEQELALRSVLMLTRGSGRSWWEKHREAELWGAVARCVLDAAKDHPAALDASDRETLEWLRAQVEPPVSGGASPR